MYKYQAVALKQVLIVYVAGTANIARPKKTLYFFPRIILYKFFLFWLIYGGLGIAVFYGFLGLGFSVDGVWGLWCGVFWVGALYINIKE